MAIVPPPVPVMLALVTAEVGAELTVYVPVAPDPVPKLVTTVPTGTLVPEMGIPRNKAPATTEATVRVFDDIGIEPMKMGTGDTAPRQ